MRNLPKSREITMDEFIDILKNYESSMCVLEKNTQANEQNAALNSVYKSIKAKQHVVTAHAAHLVGRAMRAQFVEYEW